MRLDLLRFEPYFACSCLGLNIDSFFLPLVVFGCADKDRELGEAQAEIKALRFSERLREKAVEEVISTFFFFNSITTFYFSFIKLDNSLINEK